MGIWNFLKSRPQPPAEAYAPPRTDSAADRKMDRVLLQRLIDIRALCGGTGDLIVHELEVSGVSCAVVLCEGMVDTNTFSKMFALPLTSLSLSDASPQAVLTWVRKHALLAPDQKEIYTYTELFRFIMSGFVVLLIDGVEPGIVFGIQGYTGRSVSEPSGETNERGSREGFIEKLRPNISMVRRRFKSPDLMFEIITFGEKSRTDAALVYLRGTVAPELLRKVKERLSKVRMDVVLESGYIQPFLDAKPLSLFSGVGYTERPDTLCAKVAEGRIGLIVDGTPYALIVPYLFNEHFQSLDDYAHRPYYATFIRWLKYAAFFFSILLPGFYVAVGSFHPELLPATLLNSLLVSEETTPFPLMFEALVIFFIYEIMREAGLRMPQSVGHAVSIVGALVIGDAAVSAGIIGTPMVIVVAVTAISSFVVPTLYEPITILRFAFILIGGMFGIFGVAAAFFAVAANLCAVNPLGVPATTPATPFSLYSMRDVLFRWGWKTLAQEDLRVQGLTGSDISTQGGKNNADKAT